MQPKAPEPESAFSRKLASKLPSIFQRNKRRNSNTDAQSGEAAYEMSPIGPSFARPDAQRQQAESEIEGDGKDVLVSSGASTSSFDMAVKRYDAEMKSFDRIKWVDIHLRHATVCRLPVAKPRKMG
jgi:hypothetical protein